MDFKGKSKQYIMDTYRRYPVTIVSGQGSYVFDDEGLKYLDFISGIAVCSLGHCPGELQDALKAQMGTLVHTSNLFYTLPQIALAEMLVERSFGEGKAFFCNSGAEANEAAIKLARKYHRKKGADRYEIITFNNSFHGRTYGALSATAQDKFHKGFEPMVPGFVYCRYNDIEDFKSRLTEKTAAVMIELIQAEGGVNFCDPGFLNAVSNICRERDILLIYDEVQTGNGRTGKLFAFENFGVSPDIVTLAKGIAGGLPMGVMLAQDRVASAFEPGDHASTFGGGPLVSAVAVAVTARIGDSAFLENVVMKGEYLAAGITSLAEILPLRNLRCMGLIAGVELEVPEPSRVVQKALTEGLLINITAGNVVRLVPPLTVTEQEIDEFIIKFARAIKGVL